MKLKKIRKVNYTSFIIIKYFIKKCLSLIYFYKNKKKKILFISTNESTQKLYTNHKNYIFLTDTYWIKGLLTNKVTALKYIKNSKKTPSYNKIKNYFLLNQKPDLIVVLGKLNINTVIIKKEAQKLKIPLILLNTQLNNILKYII